MVNRRRSLRMACGVLLGVLGVVLLIPSGCKLFKRSPTSPVIVGAHSGEAAFEGRWILVDTTTDRLSLMQDHTAVYTIHNIAWGWAGVGQKRRVGDGITPRGSYFITEVRHSSRFNVFLELSYPSASDAEIGLESGLINQSSYQAILRANANKTRPPQNTALGGAIGIHGLGRGDSKIHEHANWTEGCIAVTNAQIKTLRSLVHLGLPVVIR